MELQLMMLLQLMLLLLMLLLCAATGSAEYSADQCSWRGSGLTHEPGSRSVEQLYLRCSEGSIEWLYPSGALRLVLKPNVPPSFPGAAAAVACLKPSEGFRGASVYADRDGALQLVMSERDARADRTYCLRAAPGRPLAIFVQATPQTDISRKVAAFRYELRVGVGDDGGDGGGGGGGGASDLQSFIRSRVACRPCNDTELLMAVCTSDLVVKGFIKSVTHDRAHGESRVEVSALHVLRQKDQVFSPVRGGGGGTGRTGRAMGTLRTPLRCGVRPGDGAFLFTGSLHFGEAWLGCAPRYRDFRRVYRAAHASRRHLCEVDVD
ncbi:meteorin-like protein [Lampetra planeri]